MRIQHNIMAMNAYRNYNTNNSALSKNLEKLSSGYAINRAGDDAAGLAISEKMRAQITGLNTAQDNAQSGINLVQTAEGAMTEVHDMLNRMYELANQSANGTYDEIDRKQLNKEVEALTAEINRIADSTNFNGIDLLNGKLQKGLNEAISTPITLGTTTLAADAKNVQKTSFTVDLNEIKYAGEGDVITIELGASGSGNTKISFVATENETASSMVDKIVAAYADGVVADPDDPTSTIPNSVSIGGQAFKMEDDGGKLKFTQIEDPTSAADTVSPNLEVKVTINGSTAGGTLKTQDVVVGNYVAATAGTFGFTAGTDANYDGSGLNAANLNNYINDIEYVGSDTDVKLHVNEDDKLELRLGDLVLATSAETVAVGTYDTTTGTTFNFTAADGTTNIGSLVIKGNGATKTADEIRAEITIGVNSGYTHTDGGNEVVKLSDPAAGAANEGNYLKAISNAALALGASAGDEITIKVNDDGDKLLLMAGTKQIAEAALTADISSGVTFKDANGTDLLKISASATTDLTDNDGDVIKTGLTVGTLGSPSANGFTSKYNFGTTDNVQGNPQTLGSAFSTSFNLTKTMVENNGDSITIGDQTYLFQTDKDVVPTSTQQNAILVDISDLDASSSDYLKNVAARLTQTAADANAGAGHPAFSIGAITDATGTKITIVEKADQSKYTTDQLSDSAFIKDLFKSNEPDDVARGLTLQIGDTSDSFNKLEIDIQDMHAKSLGIDGIDISTQEGASAASELIKDAINIVSDVRGDLGAAQNRLEHTINSLSVSEENITSSESSIRDTDVAEEMMAYTKNNILIQSAQAMLAQANQVPQGVLQLLG